jgi:anti-sigma regulatory factor (Ser/Thr protein kinase)
LRLWRDRSSFRASETAGRGPRCRRIAGGQVPYYRCGSCGMTSYSAAGYSAPVACPTCGAALVDRTSGTLPPAPGLRRSLHPVPEAVAQARRALAVLAIPDPLRKTLALVVSELVTNSVRHASTPITLVVTDRDDDVRVEVGDDGPCFDWPVAERQSEGGGLGLTVVDALSKEWGIDRNGDGCAVWCVIPRNA